MKLQLLHFVVLTLSLCAMFIVGIVVGREWQTVVMQEEIEKEKEKNENYHID